MLSDTVMKNLLSAAWKNSWRPNIGQFELIHEKVKDAKVYMWHWGDGDKVPSQANPNGKTGPDDMLPLLASITRPDASPAKAVAVLISSKALSDEVGQTWKNAEDNGGTLGKTMKAIHLTPDNYNIHFIGHSFGGVVSAEAIKIINNKQTGKKVKQLTTLETPGLPWPHAIKAVESELAERVEVLYYEWMPDILGGGFGGPAQDGDNLLNLHLMSVHYPCSVEPKIRILHNRVVEWYYDSIYNTTSCMPGYYGFNWSFASDMNPNWPSGLSTGRMDEKKDALGCIQPWILERVREGIVKAIVQAKDGFESAASWAGNQAKIIGGWANGEFGSFLMITSASVINLTPTENPSDIRGADSQATTTGAYRQISIPMDAENLELDIRFTNVAEVHFLAVTIDGKNVLLIDPYAEGISDDFITYSASISEYAGKTVTLQIAIEGAMQEETVALIDALRFTQITLGSDINEDGCVDILDLIVMGDFWMEPVSGKGDDSDKADITGDSKVDMDDFVMLSENWLWKKNQTCAFWQMNEATGTVVSDSVGWHYGQTVNITGNPWIEGKSGNALKLDGVDDYVQVTGFKGITGPASRTCSAWIKATANGKEQMILSWGYGADGQKWMFRVQADGKLAAGVWGGYISGSVSVADGQWHHVAAVLADDGSPSVNEIKLYVDGFPQSTTYSSTQPIDTLAGQDVQLGAVYNGTAQASFFNGLLDEVRIYNLGLDGNQIYRLSME